MEALDIMERLLHEALLEFKVLMGKEAWWWVELLMLPRERFRVWVWRWGAGLRPRDR